jgi:hypothetical protein
MVNWWCAVTPRNLPSRTLRKSLILRADRVLMTHRHFDDPHSVKLFVMVVAMKNLFQEDYGNFRMRLQVAGARRVLDGVYALRSTKRLTN